MSKIFIFLNVVLIASLIFGSSCKNKYYYDYYGWLAHDDTLIDQYLVQHGDTNYYVTASGLRVIIQNPGFGSNPVSGQTVRINYQGRLLDGTVFDDTYNNQNAFTFTIGDGSVVPGLNEGVQYIKERGKVTLYIPSPLGFQDHAYGTLIPANSILVFDVDLLSIQK